MILSRHGYIKRFDRSDAKVTSFRVSELQAEHLYYMMEKGVSAANVALQAWDGEQYSNTVNIRLFDYLQVTSPPS